MFVIELSFSPLTSCHVCRLEEFLPIRIGPKYFSSHICIYIYIYTDLAFTIFIRVKLIGKVCEKSKKYFLRLLKDIPF